MSITRSPVPHVRDGDGAVYLEDTWLGRWPTAFGRLHRAVLWFGVWARNAFCKMSSLYN